MRSHRDGIARSGWCVAIAAGQPSTRSFDPEQSSRDDCSLRTGAYRIRASAQLGTFTSVLLLVSAVIIALIIYTMTKEKIRQIAMMKLIGAPDRNIIGMIVQQALSLGNTGFLFGTFLVVAIKEHFPRRVILELDNVLALGAVVVLVCLLASLVGVRAALRVDPASALGS